MTVPLFIISCMMGLSNHARIERHLVSNGQIDVKKSAFQLGRYTYCAVTKETVGGPWKDVRSQTRNSNIKKIIHPSGIL